MSDEQVVEAVRLAIKGIAMPFPEMRTPTSTKVGAAAFEYSVTTKSYGNGSSTEIAVAGAVRHVRLAEANLRAAAFRFDDVDYFCEALNDLAYDVSALLAFWAGREVPCANSEAPHLAAAAREWRLRNGRTY